MSIQENAGPAKDVLKIMVNERWIAQAIMDTSEGRGPVSSLMMMEFPVRKRLNVKVLFAVCNTMNIIWLVHVSATGGAGLIHR